MVTKENLSKTAASLESLQVREKMLSSEIEKLKTAGGTEAEIREKYGLVRPGEEVIVIVDKDGDTDFDQATTSGGFWDKVRGWFQ